MKHTRLLFTIIFPLTFLGIFMTALQTKANPSATFTVNSTLDAVDVNPGDGVCETAVGNGICTLRAAVMEANGFFGPDTIQLAAGNYLLTLSGENEDLGATGDLDITEELSIIGAGRATTTIDGNQADRIFHILGVAAVLSDMTITNGRVTSASYFGGGGILNDYGADYHPGALTLEKVTVSNNKTIHSGANSIYSGGGILSRGALTVTNSLIQANESSFGNGGGISAESIVFLENSTVSNNIADSHGGGIAAGFVHIVNSTIDNNTLKDDDYTYNSRGGGIYISYPSTIEDTIISNNSLFNGRGGGLFIGVNASLLVTNTKIISNSANAEFHNSGTRGGGIYNESIQPVTIVDSIIERNYSGYDGGGIYNEYGAGQMTLNRVTISQNQVESRGAGIHNGGTLSIVNSTIARNITGVIVNGEGAGIYNYGVSLTLNNSTVVQNVALFGGGIYQLSGLITLENTILADNEALSYISSGQPNTHNCAGFIQSIGHNLEDGGGCNFSATGDLSGKDAALFPSSTMYGALVFVPLPNSPVIDAGSNVSCPGSDQRGFYRPVDGNNDSKSVCDIGSVEFNPIQDNFFTTFLPAIVR